jgi:hypothetical protein
MTSLAYILSPKLSDAATLTGSGTVANSGIDNLQSPQPRIRTIFTSGSCYVEGDFGLAVVVDTLAVGYMTSLASTDTIRFRCKNSYPVTSSPLIDVSFPIWPTGSDLSAYYDKHRQMEFTQQTARYFRVDFSCSAAPEIGRLIVGRRIEPLNTITSWANDILEPVTATIDFSNQETRRPVGGPRRTVHLEWPPALSKTEALGRLTETILERGLSKDYLVALAHGDDETISPMSYVYLGCGTIKAPFNTLNHNFHVSVDLTEMAPLRML